MKNDTNEMTGTAIILTQKVLQELKDKGYRFVLVNGLSTDNRSDYMEPCHFILVPVKELPDNPDKKGIFEPVNSSLLAEWAAHPDEGIKVLVTMIAVEKIIRR